MHTVATQPDPPVSDNAPRYVVAVRALCEFTAKRGDLDLRFTPSPTALEGIAGHATVTARRPADYQTEIALGEVFGPLQVRGRADGYDPASNQLEEIKTHRGKLDAMPDNHRHLHWAQARVYGWLLCSKLGLMQMRIALVYFDIASQKETVIVETHSADALRAHFVEQCERFIARATQEVRHREARNAALAALAFPHASFRPGQRALAEAVYRCAVNQRCLMAQAPTGIGKTVGTLFPLLKAWPAQQFDKIFFLTAKSAGRQLALDALKTLTEAPDRAPLRVLELTAREKACEHPDRACHGESCPLARGFYDRLPDARAAALQVASLDKAALREVALAHEVCPYYLGQEMSRWSDVIVGDYNYYFDTSAMLYALAEANRWRVSVLVDEAHNLVERARGMYSATLDQAVFDAMRRTAPPPLKRALTRVARSWKDLAAGQTADYLAFTALPADFVDTLQRAISQMTDFLTEHPDAFAPETLRFYFDAMHFVRIAERFDTHSLFDITLAPRFRLTTPNAVLCLRNVIPAPHLKPRFARAHSVALFSATLTPAHFYSDTLGLPETSARVDVDSPFVAEQLQVRAIADVSTRYRDRAQSVAQVVDLIAAQYARAPGNYLSFFSSFDYLAQVAAAFAARHPHVPVWEQARAMSEADQHAFLARFAPDGCGIGFAVLGGAFGEAIDLPGTRLVGAFVATLGLPQLNPVNQQMKARMHEAFGAGYDYTYLFPGLQKVVQAAGRVIRGPDDRGVLYLIDDRFARPDVQRLLPAWWRVDVMRHCDA
ncbi:ATP-dependent DNA helicase [Caballeronia telluris]|uniref:DNA repair helicase n=1 Tax=Caballeronia telluris TaxID=326475 RepID=A0A158JQW3_9BURK|nr:ATP-dependent DNA helicase [Caballeronia telluris]SAL71272.1 DNA repair helicase [Caballeronia telluris]SAL71515.1 DNA repair helicase [Caballeronia telluris]